MTATGDDLDARVLSEINSRTLVNGTPIDTALVAKALNLDESQSDASFARLKQKGLVRLTSAHRVTITPAGHAKVG